MSHPPQYGQPGQQPSYGQPAHGQQPSRSGSNIFTDFKFSPLEWGAVAAWLVGFIVLLVSYFTDWASVANEGAGLGKFRDVPGEADTNIGTYSTLFIVASVLALIAAAAAIVLRDKFRLLARIVTAVLAALTLLFAILIMSELSSVFFKPLPSSIDHGYTTGAYLGILGAVLLGAVAGLAQKCGAGSTPSVGYGQPSGYQQ
ncbi:MAG: hypothetical protein DLM55_04220 [Acidimicrobiales bacterium]|nr:MAG: hypothetical protein DLM55_04220 [Acidimicrobiales bacterium]